MATNPNNATLNPQAESFNPVNAQLVEQIASMIESAINTQGREILKSLVNPQNNELVDEVIEERHRCKMEELDRVPDVVRCLREFSGNNTEFSSWKKNVDRILKLYEDKRGTPKYFGIISVIRNKMVVNADQVLEAYNTPLNWQAISKCLTLHYADKRDISTIEYQLKTLRQGTRSIEDFYQVVYSHLSLILNKISCAEFGHEATSLLTATYPEKALDTFVRGLNGELPSLLRIREPNDLPHALQLCLKLQNQNFRANHANNAARRINHPNNMPPLLSPRKPQQQNNQRYNQQQYVNQQNQQQPFFPRLAHIPRFNNTNQRYNQPTAPRYTNTQFQGQDVEPMDVDQTMQTRRIDYSNRNAMNAPKRPASTNNSAPRKQRRTYHLNATNIANNNHELEIQPVGSNTNQFNDINFLD